MSKKTDPRSPGFDDNPEWTKDDFARARPASEVLGHEAAGALVRRRGRPPKGEAERKEPVSIRLSPQVLAFFRSKGPGWQTMIDGVLEAYVSNAAAGGHAVREEASPYRSADEGRPGKKKG